jgi:hypothetical protein
MDEYG